MNQEPDDRSPAAAPPTTTTAVATFDVLRHEYEMIWGADADIVTPEDYYRKANAAGQAALCLSGGGIRSAAFGLGLLQASSRARLLTSFHYLSTVSGGGYIGSWLQRWIQEERAERQGADPRPERSRNEAADAVMAKLGAREEPGEIKRLRENSNFITPKIGIGSNDTWTAVAVSVRNIIINWLLFAPLLLLVVLLPNLFIEGIDSIRGAVMVEQSILYLLLGLTALPIAIATAATVRLMPSYRDETGEAVVGIAGGDAALSWKIVYPLLAWAVFATLALAVEVLNTTSVKAAATAFPDVSWIGGADVALASLAGMVLGLALGAATLRGDYARTFGKDYVIWPLAFIVTAGWVALGAELVEAYLPGSAWSPVVLAVFGPLWILTATLVGAIVFAAFRQSEGPTVRPDDDREWLARLSATKIKPMLAWAVLAPSVLLVPLLLAGDGAVRQFEELGRVGGDGGLAFPTLIAVLSGAAAIFGGRSNRSGLDPRAVGGTIMKYVPLSALIGLATLVFIVALLVVFGRLEAMLAETLKFLVIGKARTLYPWLDPEVAVHLAMGLILLVVIFAAGRTIPVNRFSLNAFYRNRLARAFLGAARAARAPDRFTGFDSADNVRLHQLAPAAGTKTVLYPVFNVALNVTATENLAWQERKAEPFVFTPKYCGSGMLSREGKPAARRTGAYVETSLYAGREPDFGMNKDEADPGVETPLGVTLATAVSLSGAAATPNMGYYSSPATAFLMTLFNVRLGAWLPNPALAESLGPSISRSGPRNSVRAILNELSGSSHDRGRDIYLSDGGHFENLALYEMVRRRCRYILVSDAASDPTCTFKDLGNAVRKIKIDLDIDIVFSELHIAGRDEPLPAPMTQLAWALGEVTYPDKDEQGNLLRGQIIYLKPSYFGEGLPVDVIAYAKDSATFPHESTADQFFSESQFESYRRLADHFGSRLLEMAGPGRSIAALFEAAERLDLHAPARSKAKRRPSAAAPKS